MYLDTIDHIATILTSVVAVGAWIQYQHGKFKKRVRLENYLRDVELPEHQSSCSVLRLVAELGMSETDIMDASLRSRRVERLRRPDPQTGLTAQVMLRYRGRT